ncbi:MAG TPA: class I SAM-dependent methyltransferase, partial [Planctomycetota bacterium]|nr:class I SAM-dependent methyltransferase [Planctomycetota bacterium]
MTAAAELLAAVRLAIDRRAGLRARLQAAGTDCLRLFHGIAEGEPGLAIDRFGPLLLLQTFRAPLPGPAVQALGCAVQAQLGEGLQLVCNHRGPAPGPVFAWHQPAAPALQQHECRERGVRFCIQARHRGQDPWLFLDLRAGRARVHALAGGKRVLNLFAYTCGAGVVAAAAGAQLVWNVDFAASALAIGARNAERNGIAGERFVLLHADCIAVLRQLAGTPVQRRARARPL